MKILFSGLLICSLFCCKSPGGSTASTGVDCYQGILKIKGPCGQRVISVISASTGKLMTDSAWIDPSGGETLVNAFSVANTCDFPENINVGDTINFSISRGSGKDCIVCFAYIPVPESKNIIETGCPLK